MLNALTFFFFRSPTMHDLVYTHNSTLRVKDIRLLYSLYWIQGPCNIVIPPQTKNVYGKPLTCVFVLRTILLCNLNTAI